MPKPKLTKPGISDLHWQVTACSPDDIAISFWETEEAAMMHARSMLASPRVSVYVAQVMHHGEHVRSSRAEVPKVDRRGMRAASFRELPGTSPLTACSPDARCTNWPSCKHCAPRERAKGGK